MVLLLAVDAFQFSMFGKDRFIAHLQCIIVIKTKIKTDSMSEDACYSLQEISQHNSSISFWIAIYSKVYDVTEFIHKVVRSEVMLTYLFIVAIIFYIYTFAPHSTQEEQKY